MPPFSISKQHLFLAYADKENEEGIIVFLDQQKAFDRIEWGGVDFVLKSW
jgi:hypothetical protein